MIAKHRQNQPILSPSRITYLLVGTAALIFLYYIFAMSTEQKQHMVGGKSDVQAANEEIQALVNKVRPDIESQASQTFKQFTAVEHRKQVVSSLFPYRRPPKHID